MRIMVLHPNNPGRTWCLLVACCFVFVSCGERTYSQGEQSMERQYGTMQIDGHLKPCPDTPNCVNSEQHVNEKASIDPLQVSGSSLDSWQALQQAVEEEGGRIEMVNDTFLHATFRSRIFRFVDDVTCRLDRKNQLIHMSSASRVGYSDFGVNRKRVEMIRARYNRLLDTSKRKP